MLFTLLFGNAVFSWIAWKKNKSDVIKIISINFMTFVLKNPLPSKKGVFENYLNTFLLSLIYKKMKKCRSPRRGIEPRSPA